MNVLMIVVDDMRPQFNCYGFDQMVTPHLDQLAQDGAIFERHYCPLAVCAPSRATLLSSCRPDTTGIYDLKTPLTDKHPDWLTLPRHFKSLDYQTFAYGKVYHHESDDEAGFTEPNKRFTGISKGRGYVLPENLELIEKINRAQGPATERADVPDNAYADGATADAAIAKMADLKDKPFFLGVGFLRPHLPFSSPAKYWDLYDRDQIKLPLDSTKPRDCPDIAMHNFGEMRNYYGIPQQGPVPLEQAKELLHGYYAGVSYTDAQVGRLLAELDRLGLRENTVVLFTADHGWMLGEHGLWCKHCNFENATRVPLIIRAPGKKPGQRIKKLTEHADIYPTLCDLTGTKTPPHVEGISLVPLMDNPDIPWKSAAFSQYPRGQIMGYSMRTDRYRITRWGAQDTKDAPIELYDYQVDPGETVNIAGIKENHDLVTKLTAQLYAGWKAALPA